MSTQPPNIVGLTPEAIQQLQELEKRKSAGEEIDPNTLEAMKAIDLASTLVDSIMSGKHVDLAFFKKASADIVRRLQGTKSEEPKRVKKKRKLYFKED